VEEQASIGLVHTLQLFDGLGAGDSIQRCGKVFGRLQILDVQLQCDAG
jgi:hypothetical protein